MSIDTSRYRYIPGESDVADIDLDATPVYLDGRRYTEADARRDDDAAGRAYHPGLVPGGKSLSDDGGHSPRLQVVVGAETARALRARALDSGMSVSKYVRRVLEADLARAA